MPRPIAILAEDEPLIRLDLADMLDGLGFEVIEAKHAGVALRYLEASNSAVLLYTDIDMPGDISGFRLAHVVAERWPQIGIIVSSACQKTVADRLPSCAQFVAKPCAEPEVRQALATLRLH